jgi:outer membrane protein assembly factor BamB
MRTRQATSCLLACIVIATAGGCTVVLPGMEHPHTPTIREAGPDRTPDQRRAKFPIDHGDYAKLGYRLDWVGYPAVTGSFPIQHVQPYDDLVAVVEQGGRLTVMETNTGARRCGDQVGSPLTRFMGITRANGQLIVATQAEVLRLDPVTCNLVGRFRTQRIVSTTPVVYGNLIVFGTGAGEILAQAITGSVEGVKAWGFGTGAAIEGAPVLVGDAIGAVSQNGEVTFVSAPSGQLRGRNRIWGGLANSPVGDDYAMYVASLDQSVYAFAADGGTQLWRYRTPYQLRGRLALYESDGGVALYVPVPGVGLIALDAGSGSVMWTADGYAGSVVAVNRGRLVAFDGQSAALIDPMTGDILESVRLPGVAFIKPDRFEDGNLYVASESGVLARFNTR